jgi:hypothetical protein
MSSRKDREPLMRDAEQAEVAAEIATRDLRMSFDTRELESLPASLRELAPTP